jgi:hypothetical protein
MEIRSSLHRLSSASSMAASSAQQGAPLKLGSIIEVMVQARLGENRFLLQPLPCGETLSAFSRVDLPISQRIHIQVIRLGNTPELRLLPLSIRSEAAVPKALRELLPKQANIDELIKLLGLVSKSPPSDLPDSVRSAMETFSAVLPEKAQLCTAEGLKRAIHDSGLFFEAKLAADLAGEIPSFFGKDLKARLLHLLAVIHAFVPKTEKDASLSSPREKFPAPDRLSFSQSQLQIEDNSSLSRSSRLDSLALKTEGVLAKITVDQLASQPQDNGAVTLQLTIPFTEGTYQDNAKLLITSDGAGACHETLSSSWTATIGLQPPGIGKFNARIVWNGSSLEAMLWSDQEDTETLMRSHCELLRARLEAAGLEAGKIMVLDQPPRSMPEENDKPTLLDLHA